ncbi:hypothetical protein LTR36_009622 [Oleoguttula mirabilis]|uniref:Probable glucan endo-1,3-beta-glucosidase eglC n=1 Tax=Oleoguttula mirabilis TaxID=1507867 RepID=A0AAV9J679_9PEZI|nr:hypothetical protein LTR36_009622 [Oleoguttula mirabilis]
MHFPTVFAAAAAVATAQAELIGFNYGSTFTDGSAKAQSDFEAEFERAQALPGTDGEFTSARLYTMIQGGTTDTPISAIPAAIDTQTSLLLGLWASAGQADFTNEITALTSAITQYGSDFTSLIVGISVGSEDLYRNSPTGIAADSGAGADPATLVDYINQVRSAISGTSASSSSIGHVDTWTAWVNGTNDAVIEAVDWLGMDAYPYFQNTISNGISVANATFFEAYDNTVGVASGKDVWVTETGWPVSGPQENDATASVANAETYWQQTGCSLFGKINTFWYILEDALPTTPSPSFGIIGSDLSSAPLYNLTCSNAALGSTASSSASSSKTSSAISTASSATKPASASGTNTESLSAAAPGPETSPVSASISQTTAASVASRVASSAASQGSSGVASQSGSPSASTMTSAAVTSSVVVAGGYTSTTYQTTLITITSCSAGCTSSETSVAGASENATSAVAPTSTASPSSASVGTAAPSPATSSATTAAAASSSASVTFCDANLNGEYQYPHLIVPVNSAEPDTAYGTQYNGTITPTTSTIFNFDLPSSYAGKTCSLVFLFPEQAALETSAFTFNGQGGISVNELSSPATQETTYDSVPSVAVSAIGTLASVSPGNSYVVASHECNAGATQAFEFVSTGGLSLEYFEDWNPSPIGAFITVC